jgi:hypothetical protein
VKVDAAGFIYLVGDFNNTVNFGGSDLYPVGGEDFFVVKLDINGSHVWSYAHGGVGADGGLSIAVDGSGNVFVSGTADTATDLGGGSIPVSGIDCFIVKYNSVGAWQWNVMGAGAGGAVAYSVTTDGSGNIYGTGYFDTAVTFAPNPPLVSQAALDMFLVKINTGGVVQWSQRRGGDGNDLGVNIAADAAGNVVVGGGFAGTANFGGSNLVATGGSYDMFLAKYNTSGAHQWSNRYGGGANDIIQGVTVLASGSILIAGYIGPATNLGGGVLPFLGEADVVVAKFSSAGGYVFDRSFGSTDDDRGNCIAADASGNAYIGGGFSDIINPGGGPISGVTNDNMFFAKYGVAEPAILNIKDIGNDQGRNVRITLSRSNLDDGTAASPVTEYQAFRRVLPLPAAAVARGLKAVPSGTWEYVASVPASNAGTYRIVAPTLADSTIANGMYRTKFFVRAATDNPSVFFDSPVDSGYSLDNLAPGIPANFAYSSGTLNWDESKASDFDYFTVYGANSNSFGSATVINYTVAPTLDVTGSPYTYFFVTATDFSGNEGKHAVAHTSTGVGGTPDSYVLSLTNYPNPFNPRTTVSYTVPSRGRVTVAVYDTHGALVATLFDGERSAGAYSIDWDGRTGSDAVASGVYFARIEHANGVKTRKMMLIK